MTKKRKRMSAREEAAFWERLEPELDTDPLAWEELEYQPRSERTPRPHVYPARFSDEEMAALQAAARHSGLTIADVMRRLIRERLMRPRVRAQPRRARSTIRGSSR
jgi:hypothetical protein